MVERLANKGTYVVVHCNQSKPKNTELLHQSLTSSLKGSVDDPVVLRMDPVRKQEQHDLQFPLCGQRYKRVRFIAIENSSTVNKPQKTEPFGNSPFVQERCDGKVQICQDRP
jgi:dihydroorotase-like cyclic amidohydrolase